MTTITAHLKKQLPRCLSCKREGEPYLVMDYDGAWYYYIDCEQCTDDIVFYSTEEQAMEAYNEKYSKIENVQ